MTFRLRLLLAALAGGIAAFGQEPYGLPVLLLAGMAGAVCLWRAEDTPWRAAVLGWAFGTGYFMHALQWIVSPFMVDVARHGWMAPFALVFLGAGLALLWGAAFWGARRLSTRAWPLAVTLPAAELVRGYIFTGFPWAMPAQATVDTALSGGLALVGPYAMNMWLALAAVLIAMPLRSGSLGWVVKVVLAVSLATFLLLPAQTPTAQLTDYTLRLVQPNAAQHEKWDPEKIPVFFNRQLDFTSAPPDGPAPDLIIWSETAIPWALDLADGALQEIARAGGAATVALGVQRRTQSRYFNSMVALDGQGAVAQAYDKHHLVPFGEYMPLGDLLARFGIYGLAAKNGNGYSSGPGAKLMDFGALGKALPLICYEAVFPRDVNATPERPDFLIQITNDAWFGKGAGPKQHLAQARMRAAEQGLPLARAANTGISAMIDPYGRVTTSLPLNAAGFIDAALPSALPATLYSRTGNLPFAILLLTLLGLAAFRKCRANQD